jgi:ABC-type transport system substrate-binding protein
MAADRNYWQRLTKERLNRRSLLTTGGLALGGAALALAGCGGSSKPSSEASVVAKPVDTTKSAKRGGVFKDSITSDATWYGYDMNTNAVGADGIAGWMYSRPVKFKSGTVDKLPDGTIEADFCESFEIAPDGMTVTFKVRPNTKWDSRAPTNGRVADSADMKFSYDRWARAGAKRATLVNEINPESPVVSVSAPDSRTFIMKLAFPYAPLLPLLAYGLFPVMMPKEADGGFDPKGTARGSAAWQVEAHEPSNVINLRRNPDWYEKERPFFDGWSLRVIPDYAQGLAQFKAGNLDYYAVRQEDILSSKTDVSSLVMTQRAQWYKSTTAWMFFGMQPDSPFRDDRVRRAISMEIDRAAWLDTFSNRDKFSAAGMPVSTRPFTFIGPGYESYLEPTEKDLGEGAKNFKFDPAEAKKLIGAAGLKTPIEVPWNVPGNNNTPQSEAIRGGITTIGDFKLEPVLVTDYAREFVPRIQISKGNFKGVAYQAQADHPDPDWTLFNVFHPSASDFYMGLLGEDKNVTRLVNLQRRELDPSKRNELLKEFQRYVSTKMYYMAPPGDIKNFVLTQPWIGNLNYNVNWLVSSFGQAMESQTVYTHAWLDDSKKKS